jgi:hypothetical protein
VTTENVDIAVRMAGARAAAAESKQVAAGVRQIGTAGKTAGAHAATGARKVGLLGKAAGAAGRPISGLAGKLKGLATGLIGTVVAFAGFNELKKSVGTTVEMGKATLMLSRNLGLSVEQASKWVAIAKVRGVSGDALATSFVAISKNAAAGQDQIGKFDKKLGDLGKSTADVKKRSDLLHGSVGKQADAYKTLGLTQKDLAGSGRNFQGFLLKIADGLHKMPGGAKRAAVAQQVLGKGWKTLLPLLNQGSKGIREQMRLAAKYGATFGKDTAQKVQNYAKAQREAQYASLGFQITLGTLVLPALTKGIRTWAHFVRELRAGTGVPGKIKDEFGKLVDKGKALIDQWKQGVGTGGQLRTTLGAVATNVKDFAGGVLKATSAIVSFVSKHPALAATLAKLAAAAAIWKGIRFGASITGLDTVIGLVGRLAKTKAGERVVSRILGPLRGLRGRAGGPIRRFGSWLASSLGIAGGRAGRRAGGTLAGPKGLLSGGVKGALTSAAGTLGALIGPAIGAAAVVGLADALGKWLKDQGIDVTSGPLGTNIFDPRKAGDPKNSGPDAPINPATGAHDTYGERTKHHGPKPPGTLGHDTGGGGGGAGGGSGTPTRRRAAPRVRGSRHGHGEEIVIHSHTYLDGKQVAHNTAKHTRDDQNRK